MAAGTLTIDELQVLITAQSKDFQKQISAITNQLDGLGKQSGAVSKTSATAFGVIAGAAQALVSKGINLITSSVGSAAKRLDTLNNSQRVFQNMGFSAKDTKTQMDFLNRSILGLPTSLDDAVGGVEALASVSGNLKDSTKTYKALNDGILAFGGSADEVRGAVFQLSQLPMDGPLDAQTWNSLRQNGLTPVFSAMAKDSHKSISQLKSDFGDGTLTVQDFTDELQKLDKDGGGGMASLEKQARDSTKGIQTGWANMKTAITRGLTDIMKAIGSENISNTISTFGNIFEGALRGISDAIPVLVSGIRDMVNVGITLSPVLAALGTAFLVLKAKMAIDAAIDAIILGFNNLRLIVIPSLLASFETLGAFLATPFGAILAGLVLAVGAVTQHFISQKEQADSLKEAQQNLKTATDSLKKSQDNLAQSQLNEEGAALAVKEAQKNYNDIVKQFGPHSLEAQQALHDLKQAQFDLKQAQNNTKDSLKDLQNKQDEVARDKSLLNAIKNTRTQIQGVGDDALKAGEKIKRLDGSTVTVKTTKNAVGQPVVDFVATFGKGNGYASGGFTGVGSVDEIAGIVHKGEYVLPQSAVDQSTGMPKLDISSRGGVNQIIVKIGEETIVDKVVKGINNRSLMNNATIIQV